MIHQNSHLANEYGSRLNVYLQSLKLSLLRELLLYQWTYLCLLSFISFFTDSCPALWPIGSKWNNIHHCQYTHTCWNDKNAVSFLNIAYFYLHLISSTNKILSRPWSSWLCCLWQAFLLILWSLFYSSWFFTTNRQYIMNIFCHFGK